METKAFLQQVITATEPGYFLLALSNGASGWLETWYRWPDDIDAIVAKAESYKDTANVYFSSYLFKAPQSIKANVLPTRTIQADLDNADTDNLPLPPNILVETSPGRHQAFWMLKEPVKLEEHEALSRRITYAIPLCDRSGWPLGRKVRIPNTFNHKYLTGPKPVKVVRISTRQFDAGDFEPLPEVPSFVVEQFDEEFIEHPQVVGRHPRELLEDIKDAIPVKVYVEYDNRQPDRSEALWALMCHAFKAGMSREQVFTLAKGSANNKFEDLRHRADQDLAKDVLRAEAEVNVGTKDPRQTVQDLYKMQVPPADRKRQIMTVVLKMMRDQGEFFHCDNGHAWYIRRDTGRPIAVTQHGDFLTSLLDVQYGLNATEPEAKFVAAGLRAYVVGLPQHSSQGALSYYDTSQNHVLIHTGRKDVLRVTAEANIETMVDGAYGVVFPWFSSVEPFTPDLSVRADGKMLDWGDELFGNGTRGYGSSVENVLNMTPQQALALLKVWFMFILLRQCAPARPILATLGQPGSGKSTLHKKVYLTLYGARKSIGGLTNMDDFDHAVSNDPLVVLDNVDTWEKWLPDRIALSAGTSDVTKRKLYTDTDTVTLKRQAIVGVTAHNPKFGREDVADRFLLLSYRRLTKFYAEQDIYDDLLRKRDQMWGSIIRDLQKVLASPVPRDNIPQFRIEDFARTGLWIARAINCEADFRAAIEDVKSAQQTFTLEEEGLLVNAVLKLANNMRERGTEPEWRSSAQLWSVLELSSADSKAFGIMYRNAVTLSKKLSSMQASLKKIVRIEQRASPDGVRQWLIGPAPSEEPTNNEGQSDAENA